MVQSFPLPRGCRQSGRWMERGYAGTFGVIMMSDLDALKTAVKETSELSKKGQHREALRLLNDAIADAKHQIRSRQFSYSANMLS